MVWIFFLLRPSSAGRTRRHRIQPPSQAGVGFGSRVGTHGLFWSRLIPRAIKLRRRRKKGPQPRKRNVFFVITSSPGTFYVGSCGIALNSTTRRHPRLGLVAGPRGPTQIHIRGLCHPGPVSRRATSALSHRADKPPGPQAPGKQARLIHSAKSEICVLFMNTRKMVILLAQFADFLFLRRCSEG